MELIEKILISYQENFWSKIITRSLGDVIYEIKSTKHEIMTSQLRQHYSSDDGLYSLKKKRLPVATFCASFKENLRTKDGLAQYNSIMIIDIDNVGKNSINHLFKQLSNDKYLFALWISPSGNGIKGLIRIDYKIDFSFDEIDMWHYTAFSKIAVYFKETYCIELDQSGKDFTRLCFISHDPNIVIKNQEEIVLFSIRTEDRLDLQKQKKTIGVRVQKNSISKKQLSNILGNPQSKNNPSDKKMMQNIIKYLKKNKKSITYEYDNWLRVGLGIASSFTYDIGIRYFDELSSCDVTKYEQKNCTRMLQDCYIINKRLIKFNTIIHLASERGFKYKTIGLEST